MSLPPDKYDVFFSYNWRDYEAVESVARALRDRGLKVFLDRWYLSPGCPWPQALEEALNSCRAVAVFLGPHGMGPWQQREKYLALDRQARDDWGEEKYLALDRQGREPRFPVIPVLLAAAEPALGFLSLNTWVDFSRQEGPLALEILAAAIRGEAPGPDLQEEIQATLATVCPYRGLRPFREEDASFFRGREIFTEKLLQAVRRQSLVALVGASGCGKSSVARAGLVPSLRREGGGKVWDVVTLVPGDRPLQALAAALIPLLEPEMTETSRLREVGKLGKALAEGEVALRDVVTRALEKQPGTDRILLLADQWEELYTLCPDEPIRCRFIDQLLEATAAGSLTVVLTLRGDFFGHALSYRPLADRLQDAVVNLGPMTGEELERAVVGPAEKVCLNFEPGLVKRILNDVREEPGNLPLLEFVLTELWEKRHGGQLLHEAYEAMGGVQGAIACRAEELFAGLTDPEQQMVRSVFIQLVKPGEGVEDTRRRAAITEVPESAQPLVKDLADARLLVTGHDRATGVQTFEVAHEALIRNWGRLRGWVDEDREFLLWSQRLKVALEEWERANRDAETLLRGAPLAEAERWLAERPQDLPPDEQDFIRESLAARERERAARERSRRRITVGALAAALVFLVLAGLAGMQWRRAGNEARRAEEQARIAISNEKKADEQRRIALSRLSHLLAVESQSRLDAALDQALLCGMESLRAYNTLAAKSCLMKALLHNPHLDTFFSGHNDSVLSVAFSPNGKTLALGSRDNTVIFWDLSTRKTVGKPLTGHKGGVLSVVFSPDGKTLASGSWDKTVILWDVATLQPMGEPLRGHEESVLSVVFSPDGKILASGSKDNTVILWDVTTRQPTGKPLTGHKGYVMSVAFSPDARILASGSQDTTVILWDLTTRQPMGEPLTGHEETVYSVAFSPDGKTLASGSQDTTIILWDMSTHKAVGEPLRGHEGWVYSAAFSPDGKTLASGSQDTTVILWDVTTRQPMDKPLRGHKDWVQSVAFSPDGKTLVSGSQDNTVILWDLTTRQPLGEPLTGHKETVYSVAFSPDGKTLASGSQDTTIILWDVTTHKAIGEPLLGHKDRVLSVAFSPNGKTLASGSQDTTIILWDVTTRQPICEPLTGHKGWVESVAFSPDGKTLASGSQDTTIILWDVTTHKAIGEPLTGHEETVYSVAFSPNGKTLASGSQDTTVILWDVTTCQPMGESLTGHKDGVLSVAFSPDGKTLASGSGGKTVILWDVITHQSMGPPLTGHKGYVLSVAFSPDGKILASGSKDNTLIVWDVTTHQPIGEPLRGHKDRVLSVAFGPDGKTLASGSDDNKVFLWDVDLESWKSSACRRANRNFTRSEWRQVLGDEPYHKTCPEMPEPQE